MKKFESGKSHDVDIFNEWFRSCTREQIPYVIIKRRAICSKVEWDYINLDPKYDKYFDTLGRQHMEHLIDLVRNHGGIKTEFTVSKVIVTAENVPSENAEKLAEDIFDYIRKLQKSYQPDPALDLP